MIWNRFTLLAISQLQPKTTISILHFQRTHSSDTTQYEYSLSHSEEFNYLDIKKMRVFLSKNKQKRNDFDYCELFFVNSQCICAMKLIVTGSCQAVTMSLPKVARIFGKIAVHGAYGATR